MTFKEKALQKYEEQLDLIKVSKRDKDMLMMAFSAGLNVGSATFEDELIQETMLNLIRP